MLRFWFVVYNVKLLPLLWLFFKIYSFFNSKFKEGFAGRKDIFSRITSHTFIPGRKSILIHSSSLGEYQQALPIVEELKKGNFNIILSFFSPSGYKNSKNTDDSILKIYLPFDSVWKVRKFFDLLNLDTIILMRYDLWFNFLYEAKKRRTRTVIANARYDENDRTWRIPLVKSFKKALFGMIDKLFVIDDEDYLNYKKELKGFKSDIIKVGDSKYERVYEAAKGFNKEEIIGSNIINGKKVFVIGSSWKEDEEIILPVLNKIIEIDSLLLTFLVPHEPKETKLAIIEKNIASKYENLKVIRFSNLSNYKDENIIIVDSIGKLTKLYSIACLSYVGGGFRSGLHNILEPVIFNVPVFFSNAVKNSDEDEFLISKGCGILVENRNGFYRDFRRLLSDDELCKQLSDKCKTVFEEKLGTAKKIVKNLNL
ncbi:hypothetical protein D4R20_01410 [bacterium]|nr:MAG: hypothetical protein D4R20_01410 [bacterium]